MRAESVRFEEGNAFAQTSHLEGCKLAGIFGECGPWATRLLPPGRCQCPRSARPQLAVRRSA